MMFAPIYTVAVANTQVQALLGDGEGGLKLWPFDEAPKDTELPYATWQNVNGMPQNYLADTPDADFYYIQVNVWGVTSQQMFAVVEALRDAIEGVAYVTRWGQTVKDAETKAFGYDFDADFITYR